ncbi:GNAT family N-acetyltransferase [Paenibacillus sp. PR3]|uniref:GNAT family N-acetyltransferase n=2 Tax=Paenibacillus terricola TaxID=2763503 RepID=A0ABR8N1V4_9BACL|nr:GNAT family N-acetyltransferase [Paenibacillus terricola]
MALAFIIGRLEDLKPIAATAHTLVDSAETVEVDQAPEKLESNGANYAVEVVQAAEDQKSILRQLIELYEYDFSEFNDADVNASGYYGYTYLDHYWTEEKRRAYLVKVDAQYAGFVLVNDYTHNMVDEDARSIAEFFIMRKYRRRGIGKLVASKVFDTFKGTWVVLQHGNNAVSHHFWTHTINEYTGGSYNEHDVTTEHWKGTGIVFRSGASESAAE